LKEREEDLHAAPRIVTADAINGIGSGRAASPLCSYRTATVAEIVNHAVTGEWSLPDFQRGFIWKSWQIRDLADSLWRDYPIGPLLLWRNYDPAEPRVRFWIADGQHRVAALCVIFGLAPAWWREGRKPARPGSATECELMFDATAQNPPSFLAKADESAKDGAALVPVRDLLRLNLNCDPDRRELEAIIDRLWHDGAASAMPDVYARLARVSLIREKPVSIVMLAHPRREDILEVFRRQIGGGIRFRRELLRIVSARWRPRL
jgi:hypothetical protein